MKTKSTFLLVLVVTVGIFLQTAKAIDPITVSGSNSADGTYASLTNIGGAFAALNGTSQAGQTITISISGDVTTEDGATGLTGAAGLWTSLTINPSGIRTISGLVDGKPLIDLNGADNVTIDGLNSGGNSLTITNTSTSNTAGTSTIRFINDASTNTIKNCTLKGSSTDPAGGILLFSPTTGTIGNDGNTIDHNDITNAGGNRPVNAIYSLGQTGTGLENSGNAISNNNIYDFLNRGTDSNGVFLGNYNTAWTISGNSFYETQNFVPTSDFIYYVLRINSSSGTNFTVSNNNIGGSAASCAGISAWNKINTSSNFFYGIYINVGTAIASNLQGNIITNFNWSNSGGATWFGISASGNVNIGTTAGNVIGASTGTNAIKYNNNSVGTYFKGISLSAFTGVVQNNTVSSITVSNTNQTFSTNFTGIDVTGASPCTVSNNTIGSTTEPGSINATSASTGSTQNVYGIYSNATSTLTVTGNTISNLTNGSTNTTDNTPGLINGIFISDGSNVISNNTIRDLTIANAYNSSNNMVSVGGIVFFNSNNSSGQTVSGNTIYSLSNSYSLFAGHIMGLYFSSRTGSVSTIAGNFIYGLTATSAAASMYGIKIGTSGTNCSNNIISLGNDSQATLYGIWETGSANNNNNLYFNTVYISGSPTSGDLNSYALYSNVTTNLRNFRNNIFCNKRSKTSATTGKHYAAYFYTSPSATGLTEDYNNYYAPGTNGGTFGYFNGADVTSLDAWKTATGKDANSLNVDPGFAAGTSPSNFFPSATLPGITGTGITGDFNQYYRNATPKMGALESTSSSPNTVDVYIGASKQASYLNLKSAFDKINDGTHTGNLILKITGNQVLPASALLNASGTGSASYSAISIYPASSGLRIDGDFSSPLIDLNGADNVTFDGRVNATGSANDLVIANTGCTIRFINDATYNTMKYCIIKGSTVTSTSGILFFSTTTGTAGNSSNTIDHNNITNADVNRAVNAIYALGTATYQNSNNTISNNNVYDFFNRGIASFGINLSTNNTAWTILGNSFYETTSFAPTASVEYRVINIVNTSGINFTVSNNYIGGNLPFCAGAAWTKTTGASPFYNNAFYAIYLSVGTGTASNVMGNTTSNFSYANSGNKAFYGIWVNSGVVNIGTTAGNMIGATSGNGSITFTGGATGANFYGIYIQSNYVSDIRNNTIGAITVSNGSTLDTNFYGIYKSNTAGATTISNNTIGSPTEDKNIYATSASSSNKQLVYGIYNAGTGSITISGNTVANAYNACTSTTGYTTGICTLDGQNTISNNIVHDLTVANANISETQSASVSGIAMNCTTTSYVQTVTRNTIYSLRNNNASFAGFVIGLFYAGKGTQSTVSGNFIYGLEVTGATSTTASLYGIYSSIAFPTTTTTYSNNIVTLGGDTKTVIKGIYGVGGTNSFYFNTVYISGDLASGTTNPSYAFYSNSLTTVCNYQDNVFNNVRSTASGTGSLHYAAYFTVPSTGSITCDYNNYVASGTGGMLGNYGTDQSALPIVTSQDVNSKNTDPLFVKEKGVSPTDYIPKATGLAAINGTGITTDYRGTVTRSGSPTMGAWEYGDNLLVWNGSTDSNWGTKENWTPATAAPGSTSNVVIPNVATKPWVNEAYGSPALCNNIVIASDSKLTIASAKALAVNANLINYADSTGLRINSDANGTGSLMVSGTVSGSASIQRYMAFDRWHLLSSPTAAQTIKDFIAKNVDIPIVSSSSGTYGMRDYSTGSTSEWNSYFTTEYLTTNSIQAMGEGEGYLVRTVTSGTPFKLRFQGALNSTGSKSISVSRSGENGWNCIGNPYTSAIKIYDGTQTIETDNFINVNDGNFDPLFYGAYFWNDADKKYDVINKSSVETFAQVGQGFFVRKKDDVGVTTMSVTPAMQFHQGAEALKSGTLSHPTIQLIATSSDLKSSTDIKFIDGTSEGLDIGYDAGILKADPTFALYTKLVKDIGIEFQLQCLPTKQYNNLVIPVGIDSKAGGEIVFTVETVQLEAGCKAILEDKLTNTFTDLSKVTYKAAVAANTAGTGRFFLHTGDIISGVEDQLLQGKLTAYAKGNKEIRVLGEVGNDAVATLVNGLGQVVLTKKLGAGNLNIIGLPNLKSGLYMLNINDKGTPQTIKIMIRK